MSKIHERGGWKLDIADGKFRICANVAQVIDDGSPLVAGLGSICSPWFKLSDVQRTGKRVLRDVLAEGGRVVKRLKKAKKKGGGK